MDDSNYIHSLTCVNLDDEQFKNITAVDVQRLRIITVALKRIVEQRAVADGVMRRVLTAEQYSTYTDSFNYDISHVESDERDDMPLELHEYMQQVALGDKCTRIANLFKKSRKRGNDGKTACERWESNAFGCYEEAIMNLCNCMDMDPKRNPQPDAALAHNMQRWLDRDVNVEAGFQPDISVAGVPRVRGSKSKYVQDNAQPAVGVRLRKHWRQREALANAALELIYGEPVEAVLSDEQQQLWRENFNKWLRVGVGDKLF